MRITVDGYSSLTGTPVAILRLMQDARFFDRPEGDEYINTIKEETARLFGVNLAVSGSTYPERAESLLRELAKNNMIKIEEE